MQTKNSTLSSARTYFAIDLKSYYASVECIERHLDPLTTNLVVADASRTEKTICLAVSPSLKAYGIPGRARLFEVIEKVKQVNAKRLLSAPGRHFTSQSHDANALASDSGLELTFITAPPQMRKYMEISSQIYKTYLKFVASQDIHVYSIDECFIDVTSYLQLHKMTAKELCAAMIREVLHTTGITAAGGIGTNLFLAKVAMDIVAKHVPADKDGVRIAKLDEQTFRQKLWAHEPLTDFWRIGAGTAKKLAQNQIYTMGDIARCSIGLPPTDTIDTSTYQFGPDGRSTTPDSYFNEKLLYKLFGVNAELLIDHAWGYEPSTISQIKAYQPENNSLSSGQVLSYPYNHEKCTIIIREMTDLLVLDLVKKELLTDQIVLTIGYDIDNTGYKGAMSTDHYGRRVPKPAHSSINLGKYSSSTELIMKKTLELYEQITDPRLLIRRVTICANHVIREVDYKEEGTYEQLDFFTDFEAQSREREENKKKEAQEKKLQQAILSVQDRFGKNALLKGTSFIDGATTRERNGQVGGHKG